MNNIGLTFSSIDQIAGQYLTNDGTQPSQKESNSRFEEVLRQKQNEQVMENSNLKFSKHASMRLSNRDIDLTKEVNDRLEHGVEQASQKGIRESLVLVDSLAFIVNVPNRTVVTAMDQTETNNNVFTNIDGAVII